MTLIKRQVYEYLVSSGLFYRIEDDNPMCMRFIGYLRGGERYEFSYISDNDLGYVVYACQRIRAKLEEMERALYYGLVFSSGCGSVMRVVYRKHKDGILGKPITGEHVLKGVRKRCYIDPYTDDYEF